MLNALIRHVEALRVVAFARGHAVLPILPTAAGIELRVRPDYSWDGLRRGSASFTVIQTTIGGQGQLDYEGRHHVLLPGSTMLVQVPHAHRYFVAPGDKWRFFFFVLAGRDALDLTAAVLRDTGPVLALNPAAIDRLAALCLRLVDHDPVSPGTASAIAYEVMTVLVDHAGSSGTDQKQDDDWVAPVLDHIAGHVEMPLPVETLAEIAGLSRAHFVRRFTRHLGIAPSDYIFRERMEKAARLLEISGSAIGEIAGQCGFHNANYFAKAFRRAFDVSPTEFRASGMYRTRPPASDER